jgi:hypothetical protein
MDVEQHRWAGRSGEAYTYVIYEWPARLSPTPGNFVFVRFCPRTGWLPFLIGETSDLSALAFDRRVKLIATHSATHVHIRRNLSGSSVRRKEVQDLEAKWRPPGNEPSVMAILGC